MKRNTKIFLKSFFCGLFLFALVSSVLILSQSKTNASQNLSSEAPNLKFIPQTQDKFSILLTISKTESDSPHSYFLLSFRGSEGKINVARIPAQCLLSQKGEDKIILKETFDKGGGSAATKAVSEYFGITVSRYISFTNQNFISFIDLFDPTPLDITENLSQVDKKNDIYIKIDKGSRLIGGALMLDIFSYTMWERGQDAALYEGSRAVCAFLSQNGGDFEKGESFIFQNTKNNLSVADLENRRDLLTFLLSDELSPNPAQLSGEYAAQSTEFSLSQSSRTKISSLFS